MFERQSSVEVVAPGGLLVKEGERSPWRRSGDTITVVPTERGMQVNAERYPVQTLIVRGKEGKLRIKDFWMTGSVRIIKQQRRLLVVNVVAIEEYLVGVLVGEVPLTWPLEALKVQAIASRSYALYQRAKGRYVHYDLVATTRDQVFVGASPPDPTADEHRAWAKAIRAVNATRGQFLAFDGQPILAAYHSTAAGPTEDAYQIWLEDIPYLTSVACPWDRESKYYRWVRKIPITRLEQRLRTHGFVVGIIDSITPVVMTGSGRVGSLRIIHSKGNLMIRGEDLRKALGYTTLLSTNFEVQRFGATVVFHGKGAGHGVGLCQWGAKELAESGFEAHTILQYYYPGTVIQHIQPD